MLQAVVVEGAELTDSVYVFTARCALLRSQVETAIQLQAGEVAKTYVLPDCKSPEVETCRTFRLAVPQPVPPSVLRVDRLEAARKQAKVNIGWLPEPLSDATWASLSLWLSDSRLQEQTKKSNLTAMLLVMDTVEKFVYLQAATLVDLGACNSNSINALPIPKLADVQEVVDQYHKAVTQFGRSEKGAVLSTEILSREVLVVCVCFCVAHAVTVRSDPLLKEYSVALDFADLRHLVLSEKHSVDALLHTAKYLRSNRFDTKFPVFSGLDSDATFKLARRHALANPNMLAAWKVESELAAERQAARWATVQHAKERLTVLDAELSELESSHLSVQTELAAISWGECYRKKTKEVNALCAEVSNKKREIQRWEAAPSPILQPLPVDEDRAMPIIFFIFMPVNYQVLSRLSYLTQQLMLPSKSNVTLPVADKRKLFSPIDIEKLVRVKSPNTLWRSYYVCQSTTRKYDAVSTTVVAGSFGEVISGNWYSKNVRRCGTSSNGVWYPDSLIPTLNWTGTGWPKPTSSSYFNPFANVPVSVTVNKFTEPLAPSEGAFQWAMEQHGSLVSQSRGNWPEAGLQDKPLWLPSKSDFLCFGSLRAMPNQQMRKLCVALHERALPLDHPAVRRILQMVMFHVGELSNEEIPATKWRIDMEETGGWDTLCRELDNLLDEVQNRTKDHAIVLLLGELAAVASQWHLKSRDTARKAAQIARCWANAVRVNFEKAPPAERDELRGRCALFSMYEIISHSAGILSRSDVSDVLQAAVLAEHNRLFGTNAARSVRPLTPVAYQVLTRRLPLVLAELDRHPTYITKAVKLVLDGTPNNLSWHRVSYGDEQVQCYEAVCDDGHLYSINVQSGVILFDGSPPGLLPSSILSIPLYQRTFGADTNFEVAISSTGVLTTTRLVLGRRYSFSYSTSTAVDTPPRLTVLEMDEDTDTEWELLDNEKEWTGDLPLRLKEMHSFWLCRKQGRIALRGRLYHNRDIFFMLLSNELRDNLSANNWASFQVPNHQKKSCESWSDQLWLSCEQLVVPTSIWLLKMQRVLAKFESPKFIHLLLLPNKDSAGDAVGYRFAFELPRFNLRFDLNSSSGVLESVNYSGFQLRQQQQQSDTLNGFCRYLVLQSRSRSDSSLKLLLPRGTVSKTGLDVTVTVNTASNATLNVHVFQVHQRFLNLEVSAGPLAVEARLQLAALYAASDTGLRGPFGRTGGELAVELLRQSWVNRPLSSSELKHLNSVAKLGHHTPTLLLLCSELLSSSRGLKFLFMEQNSEDEEVIIERVARAGTDYLRHMQAEVLNSRVRLNADEETHVLGTTIQAHQLVVDTNGRAGCVRSSAFSPPASSRTACKNVIASVETIFRSMVEIKTTSSVGGLANMMSLSAAAKQNDQETAIKRVMDEKLAESCAAWEAVQSVTLRGTFEALLLNLEFMRSNLCDASDQLETEILSALSHIPVDADSYAAAKFAMHRAANMAPEVTRMDLLQAAGAQQKLLQFNPFLTNSALKSLHRDILVWLQACVMEDKLCRMIDLAHTNNTQEFERELQEIGRKWDVQKYPEWLVFEVHQRLQIRHVQYAVTQELLSTPGAIIQLNMGEGKTRVILPLLVLSLGSGKRLSRLNFLSALLDEAYDYLHCVLTASPMCRRVSLLPFHRDVKVTAQNVRSMHHSILRYTMGGGVVCVAREHRLSLHLKFHELMDSGDQSLMAVAAELQKLEELSYFDILDESDELLRHKFQLTYAMGGCCKLPSGPERWEAAAALLGQLMTNKIVKQCIAKVNTTVSSDVSSDVGCGMFSGLRLISGPALDLCRNDIHQALAHGVITNPPYSMRWLENCTMKKTFISFVSDPAMTLNWLLEQPGAQHLRTSEIDQLLALRGLLACGLLVQLLCRRYRVDYGISDCNSRGSQQRVAVPFRASDTPAERAEYSQPDTLIVLTLLSYYRRGLSVAEFVEACAKLQSLGPEAKKAEYALWFDSALGVMTDKQLEALKSIDQLDTTNASFVTVAHRTYKLNMAAIEFWLKYCVFPVQTMQFPHKITANAFNLTDNSKSLQQFVGFSGTKDNYLLLPLNVCLTTPSEDSTMIATDGKMVDLVFRRNERVECLAASNQLSRDVLQLALSSGVVALIDAGATMAGLSNEAVADEVLKLLATADANSQSSRSDGISGGIKGVVYFNTLKSAWYVVSRDCCRWPLGSSPIHESEAFVYFDESRCRGADMKMLPTATALVTTGPDMCKDKIMQAAGRMRKLMFGQKLIFAVPAELVPKVRAANALADAEPLRPPHLLQWVIHNTVKATEGGLPEWAAQASHFNCTRDPSTRKRDECYDLESMYGGAIIERTVQTEIQRRQEHDLARVSHEGNKSDPLLVQTMREKIAAHAEAYGSDVSMVFTGMDEECERELECEREHEKEVERQLPRQHPVTECKWAYSKLLTASSPSELPVEAGVMSLQKALSTFLDSTAVDSIQWNKCGIFVTTGFFRTVETAEGAPIKDLGEYLRPVDAVVQFKSGECLLLSELEADGVLEAMWRNSPSSVESCPTTMCSLCYLREAAQDNHAIVRPQLLVPFACGPHVTSPYLLAGLSLFAGHTMFPGASQLSALAELLPTEEARKVALSFAALRGQSQMIARSDLEKICTI